MALGLTKVSNQGIEAAESVAATSLEWASDTGGTVINAAADEWWVVVNIQVSVTFPAGADMDAEVHVRKSADNGTTEDTEEEGTYLGTIPYVDDGVVTKTFPVYDFDYLDVGLKNLDGAAVTYTAIYDGYKITGMS